jgi:Carboxypeptidase regulatory-like domain
MKNVSCLLLFLLVLLGCKSQPAPEQSSSSALGVATIHVDPTTAGSIGGVVTFRGVPPKTATIDMTQDPGCPSQPQPSQAVVVNNSRLANVFVYVKEGLPQGRFPIPPEPAVLDQKGCRYIPHMQGITAGQQFKILNTDTADHNVHDLPRNNPEWNESQKPSDPAVVKTFPHPEMMIPIQCNQHPWMKAYINVMSNPYFAVSDSDGSFQISNLPPGEYTLAAVHEKFGEQTVRVRVNAKESTRADFLFAPRQ